MSNNGPSVEDVKNIHKFLNDTRRDDDGFAMIYFYNYIGIERSRGETDEDIEDSLKFYVRGRLGQVPVNPYMYLYGGSWVDWKRWIGEELLKEWYETCDWYDDEEDEQTNNDEKESANAL